MANCESCAFCYQSELDDDVKKKDDEPDFVECRKHAPWVLHGSGTGWSDQRWPRMKLDDWCGDWSYE